MQENCLYLSYVEPRNAALPTQAFTLENLWWGGAINHSHSIKKHVIGGKVLIFKAFMCFRSNLKLLESYYAYGILRWFK
jgi:hypothetical protein